jgi:hypothetical protein
MVRIGPSTFVEIEPGEDKRVVRMHVEFCPEAVGRLQNKRRKRLPAELAEFIRMQSDAHFSERM